MDAATLPDDEEGRVVRTCAARGQVKALLDSEEYLDDATLEDAECPCDGSVFNTAVGFASMTTVTT